MHHRDWIGLVILVNKLQLCHTNGPGSGNVMLHKLTSIVNDWEFPKIIDIRYVMASPVITVLSTVFYNVWGRYHSYPLIRRWLICISLMPIDLLRHLHYAHLITVRCVSFAQLVNDWHQDCDQFVIYSLRYSQKIWDRFLNLFRWRTQYVCVWSNCHYQIKSVSI